MSGQVLDSCTTGLRSFSAMSRRSAALSRSALDSTFAFSHCNNRQYRRDRPYGASAQKPGGIGSMQRAGLCDGAQLSHSAVWLRIRAKIGNSAALDLDKPQGRKRTMRTRDYLLNTTFAVTFLLLPAALPAQAQAQSTLTGVVTSTEEGAMEGVVVSAKKDGSTITISVVTDAQGRFSFPANRLEPGSYT